MSAAVTLGDPDMRARLLRRHVERVAIGDDVYYVRLLGARPLVELADLIDAAARGDMTANARLAVRALCYAVCDEAGERLFADDELGELDDVPWSIVEKLSKAALELSGVFEADVGN